MRSGSPLVYFQITAFPRQSLSNVLSNSGEAHINSDLVKGFKDVERRKRTRTATSKSMVMSLNPLICANTVELQLCSTRCSSNAVLAREQWELYY